MRTGVFGGSFDPPHMGHLVLAMQAVEQLQLDRLLWAVTASPPHKQDQALTPVEQRVEMVQAAIRGNPAFVLSRIEIDRPGPHYAADTLQMLKRSDPQDELCYLIGGDSLRDLPGWYQPALILEACSMLGVMRRVGDCIDLTLLEEKLPGITAKIRFIETPILQISSSDIRARIVENRAFRYFLPAAVYHLIKRRGFYKNLPQGK